jgi:hypothetical protein
MIKTKDLMVNGPMTNKGCEQRFDEEAQKLAPHEA